MQKMFKKNEKIMKTKQCKICSEIKPKNCFPKQRRECYICYNNRKRSELYKKRKNKKSKQSKEARIIKQHTQPRYIYPEIHIHEEEREYINDREIRHEIQKYIDSCRFKCEYCRTTEAKKLYPGIMVDIMTGNRATRFEEIEEYYKKYPDSVIVCRKCFNKHRYHNELYGIQSSIDNIKTHLQKLENEYKDKKNSCCYTSEKEILVNKLKDYQIILKKHRTPTIK
jgi:hypothetical protein